MSTVEQRTEAEAFVEAFAEGWRAPGGAAGLVEAFRPWLHEDVRLVQPQLPTLVGHEEFRTGFAEPLFELMPDLHGEVVSWAARGDLVWIEVRLSGTLAGRPFGFTSADKITLRDGKAVERVAFMDPSPMLAAALTRPRSWPLFARMQRRNIQRRLRRKA